MSTDVMSYHRREDKSKFIDDKIQILTNILLALEDVRNGLTEAEACRKHNLKQGMFRYFVFNDNLGNRLFLDDYASNPTILFTGEERLYVAIMTQGVDCIQTKHIRMPSNVREVVNFLISDLGERDTKIIHLRYWDGLTVEEIGEEIGITRQRVSQKISTILRSLYRKNHSLLTFGIKENIKVEKVEQELPVQNKQKAPSDTIPRADDICVSSSDISARMWNALLRYNLGWVRGRVMHINKEVINVFTQVNLNNLPSVGTPTVVDFIGAVSRLHNIQIPTSDVRYDNIDLTTWILVEQR